ncbi:hypothetical protein PROFUN_11230 [Planoprotostelium fungivorum]|uniref:Uncharacterized protein n=1 Tax=Planoprotostelium fungivorum TaxID=1890364 RepID=A0A2P6NA36_9EUKA|nr:hypothetical protein PROFUN_11230 [Planoprotostelium fungivorum]
MAYILHSPIAADTEVAVGYFGGNKRTLQAHLSGRIQTVMTELVQNCAQM